MRTITHHRVAVLFALGFVLISACNRNQTYLPGIDIPLEAMNQELEIYVPPEANTFEQGQAVGLVVMNNTDAQIFLEENQDIKIFIQDSGDWISIENNIQSPERKRYVPTNEVASGGLFLFAIPQITQDVPTQVRIVIIAHWENPSPKAGVDLAAYTDVELRPVNE